mgnify:CR=1 FL=1
MKTFVKLATVSMLALMVAAPVSAQNQITGIEGLNDQIDDITDDVNEDIARGDDDDRYGPNGVALLRCPHPGPPATRIPVKSRARAA